MRLFQLRPLPPSGPREKCTVGALRAEATDVDVRPVSRVEYAGLPEAPRPALDLLSYARHEDH